MQTTIDQLFEKGINALKEKHSLFQQIEKEPNLIITKLFNPSVHQPYYEFPFLLFGKSKNLLNTKVEYHEMQQYLESILKGYFKSIDEQVELTLTKSNSYTSTFTISYETKEIIRFSIYTHQFSDFRTNNTQKTFDDGIQVSLEFIERSKEQLETFKSFLEKPIRITKGPLEYLLFYPLYWKNKEKLHNHLKERISYYENEIKRHQEHMKYQELAKVEFINSNDFLEEKFDFWKEKLLSWNYKEVKKRSLY